MKNLKKLQKPQKQNNDNNVKLYDNECIIIIERNFCDSSKCVRTCNK